MGADEKGEWRHLAVLVNGWRGYRRLSLETGAMPYFKPAHAFYHKFGFTDCGPFATYAEDLNSIFMTKQLEDAP